MVLRGRLFSQITGTSLLINTRRRLLRFDHSHRGNYDNNKGSALAGGESTTDVSETMHKNDDVTRIT